MNYLEPRLTHVSRQLRAANAEFDALTSELALAIGLLRQIREAVKTEGALKAGKYAGLALGISALLDRFPSESSPQTELGDAK